MYGPNPGRFLATVLLLSPLAIQSTPSKGNTPLQGNKVKNHRSSCVCYAQVKYPAAAERATPDEILSGQS